MSDATATAETTEQQTTTQAVDSPQSEALPKSRDEFYAMLEKMDSDAAAVEAQRAAEQASDEADAVMAEVAPEETAEKSPEDKGEKTEEAKVDPEAALKAEREKLEKERLEFESRKAAFDAQAAKAKADLETAEKQAADLERYAKEWEETGQTDLAQSAREKAATIRRAAQTARQESERAEFRLKQEAVLREVVKEHPDLSKPDSQMTRDMDALLRSRPQLLTYPEGIRDAAQFLAARSAMSQAQALQKENAELKAKVDALQKRLRPATAKGTPSAPRGQPSFEQLDREKQRAQLLAAARRADAGG